MQPDRSAACNCAAPPGKWHSFNCPAYRTPSAATVERRCVKCGSDDINVDWHGEGEDHYTRQYAECRKYGRDRGQPEAEHLCCTCRVCQYRWKEDVLDALAA